MKIWSYKSKKEDNLSKQVEKNPDIVMTKPSMAIDLINRINFKDNDIVIEPCRGTGSFYNNLPNNIQKMWCEINEGKDYLEFNEKVDYTISNPPFVPRKLFWSFQQKAMETTRKKIYWLLNITCLNVFTPKRLNEMKEKGWFINSFYVVADKRWYGRYVWLEIGKENNNFFNWSDKTY